VIEVTNDQSNANSWIEIDRREDNADLNGNGIVHTFPISHPQSGGFRCIRLRQIGLNHYNNNHLCIGVFELFGELRIRTSIPR
jgi:hypothetical protein